MRLSPLFAPVVLASLSPWAFGAADGALVPASGGERLQISVPSAAEHSAPPLAADARAAGGSGPSILGVRVGFNGRYKAGAWTPIEVAVQGGAEDCRVRLMVSVPDSDGVDVLYPAPVETELHAGAKAAIAASVRCGRVRGRLTVELRCDGDVAARRTFSSSASDVGAVLPPAVDGRSLWVVWGDARPFRDALVVHGVEPEDRPELAEISAAGELPRQWYEYEGVDALIVQTSDVDRLAELAADRGRASALRDWVRLGGRLIVTSGAAAAPAWRQSEVLGALLPSRSFERVELRQAAAVESYCRSSTALLPPGGGEGLPMAAFAEFDGAVETAEGKWPLVVQTAFGLGRVKFFASDLNCAPMAAWRDRPLLVSKLLELPPVRGDEGTARGVLHAGYQDLSGQLRSSLDQFESVRAIPFWVVACAAAFYLLLVAPFDYYLMQRFGMRLQWTWLTFALSVALLVAGVVWTAGRFKGDQTAIRQIEVIDVDHEGGIARGQLWFNVFSPRTQRCELSIMAPSTLAVSPSRLEGGKDLSSADGDSAAKGDGGAAAGGATGSTINGDRSAADPGDRSAADKEGGGSARPDNRRTEAERHAIDQTVEEQTLLAWQGLSGRALGGMDVDALWGDGGMSVGYATTAGRDRLEGVPLPIWCSKAFTARWTRMAGPLVEATLSDPARHLTGRVTNRSGFVWEDCLLAYDRWGFELGRLRPGETAVIGTMSKRSELKTLLTGRRLVYDDSRDKYHQQTRPFDQTSSDASYVLRAMLFHTAAGGREYTKWPLGRESWIDLSGLLPTGRAVLVVRVSSPEAGSRIVINGRPQEPSDAATIYRFLLRVETQP